MLSFFVYGIATILNAFNLLGEGYFLVMLGDLETDYINPIDLCNKLNPLVIPQMIIEAVIAGLFFITGHWKSFLIFLPLTLFNAYIVSNNQHVYDATEIFKTVGRNKRDSFIKLLFHVFVFFYLMLFTILALVDWLGDEV